MDINKLPNVKTHWIKDGYLTIQLNTGDYIRFNFNNIEALIKQCSISDVIGRSEQLPDSYRTELSNVKQLAQTQTSLDEQLQILRPFANKLGLYDAADYLRK